MSQNSDFLMRHVKSAQALVAAGVSYSANDNKGEAWAVSDQRDKNGRQTGNVVVVCVDDHALSELAANLRAEGYGIDEFPSTSKDAGALVITPPAGS